MYPTVQLGISIRYNVMYKLSVVAVMLISEFINVTMKKGFSHTSSVAPGMAICLKNYWMGYYKFGTHVHVSLSMNCNSFGGPCSSIRSDFNWSSTLVYDLNC